jgi:beta-galactosidase
VHDSVQSKIEKYVKDGGHFVTTYFSGIVDENDHVRLGGYPGAFIDLLGVRIEEFAPLLAEDAVELDDGSIGTIWTDDIDLTSDVHVLRKYASGELDGKPAVTLKSHGHGSAIYVSTRLNVKGLKSLLPELLEKSGVSSSLPESLISVVDQVIRTDGKIEWVFWINRTHTEIDLSEAPGKLLLASGGASLGKLAGRGIAVFRRTV